MKLKISLFVVVTVIIIGIISVSWVVPNLGKKNFIPVFLKGNRLGNSIIYDTHRDLGSIRNIGIGTTKPTESLDVVGTIKGDAFSLGGVVITEWPGMPSGGIIMWSGAINNIPNGWALCDGNNGTPNLTSRFIMSIPNASTDPGAIGGAISHNHDGGSYTAAAHTHSGTTSSSNSKIWIDDNSGGTDYWGTEYTHTHNFTTSSAGGGQISGSSAPESNLPPYYELAFIMKL